MRAFLVMVSVSVCFAFISNANAHPHMFIDTRLELGLGQGTLEELEITWYFDPFFTASIAGDYDADGDGEFSSSETEQVRQNAFSNLENYCYFTFVTTREGTFTPESIEDFSVFMKGDTLAYEFSSPMDLELPGGEFSVVIYDETFYCDILYHPSDPVTLSGSCSDQASCRIVENRDIQINYGGSVSVSREGSSYSGTAFPQQVVVDLAEN